MQHDPEDGSGPDDSAQPDPAHDPGADPYAPPAPPGDGVDDRPPRGPTGFVQTNPLAITSLVLAILGLVSCGGCGCFGLLLTVPAVITGHVALSQIKATPDRFSGQGLAIAGLIIGYLSVLLTIVGIVFGLAIGAMDQRNF